MLRKFLQFLTQHEGKYFAVSSVRQSTITFTGDVSATDVRNSGTNIASPAQIQVVALAIGANTITPPGAITGAIPTSLTIIPPIGNASLITLKGIAGDTGVPLHKTDPTIIALDSTFASLVLNVAAGVTVRLVWA